MLTDSEISFFIQGEDGSHIPALVSSRQEEDRTIYQVRGSEKKTQGQPYFLGLSVNMPAGAVPWNFDGPVENDEIYRQSPHDTDAWIVKGIARQSVPMIAWHSDNRFHVLLNGSPYLYDNGCSQKYDLKTGMLELRSGDDGETPGLSPKPSDVEDIVTNEGVGQKFTPGRIEKIYHADGHEFNVIGFSVDGTQLKDLRRAVNLQVARGFALSSNLGEFGAYAHTTAWMNLRKNETGLSEYWVVPQISYFNRQYNRDAFWISFLLDRDMSRQCLRHELAQIDYQAEYPLFAILWALRLKQEGVDFSSDEKSALSECFARILQKGSNGWYCSHDRDSKRLDFQYWADVIAFDPEDTVTYNQGLYALVLRAGADLGLEVPDEWLSRAENNYRALFREDLGCFTQSRFKPSITGVDMLVPDLLSQYLFARPLATTDMVEKHFHFLVNKGLSPWGFKCFIDVSGEYLRDEQYTVPGYVALANKGDFGDAAYTRGGSWFVYDTLFLLNAAVHRIPSASALLVWRIRHEWERYGTTYEYMNSMTGDPHKPNMGWTVCIYALVDHFMKNGSLHQEVMNQIDA